MRWGLMVCIRFRVERVSSGANSPPVQANSSFQSADALPQGKFLILRQIEPGLMRLSHQPNHSPAGREQQKQKNLNYASLEPQQRQHLSLICNRDSLSVNRSACPVIRLLRGYRPVGAIIIQMKGRKIIKIQNKNIIKKKQNEEICNSWLFSMN